MPVLRSSTTAEGGEARGGSACAEGYGPTSMATGDRGVARRAKTGLPRHSFATAGGFGGVPLGFATDAPRRSAGSFTELQSPAFDRTRSGGRLSAKAAIA